MKLGDLIPEARDPLASVTINQLTQDSREARAETLFFAIEGSTHDGHDFLSKVLSKGAVAVARAGHPCLASLGNQMNIIEVTDTRQAMGEAAARFHGEPSKHMLACGVTGTNGKTTSTYLLEALLEAWGQKTAVIGTVENRFGEYRVPSTHTTPGSLGLQSLLSDFARHGATAVAMEVTSHALDQKRVAGVKFDAAIFTNLTQDHLDYHQTMEEYYQAKARFFFDYPSLRVRAIHVEDPYGKRLAEECRARGLEAITFGREGCDVNYGELALSARGIEGEVPINFSGAMRSIPIRSPMIGSFNVQNLTGAIAVGVGLGIPPEIISSALATACQVPGRMETVPNERGITVVVDYAHTPDALEKALKTLHALLAAESTPHSTKRLLCVFGCGGDRDATKRPLMGEIAERLADTVFVTSDNPRTEDPGKIIDDILSGFKRLDQAHRFPDRKIAINHAISLARAGDIVLIAGKGHEDYQIVGTQKLPFDDRKVATEALKAAKRE